MTTSPPGRLVALVRRLVVALVAVAMLLGLGLTLAAFVALVFALTVVKVKRGDPMQGFDHTIEPSVVPQEKTE